MYVRFTSPERISARGVHAGLFWGIRDILDDEVHPECLRKAIEKDYDWFCYNLPAPKNCYAGRQAICWFNSTATEMISRAFVLASLLGECGVFITPITTAKPGIICYRDEFQIVAKPETFTPTSWG